MSKEQDRRILQERAARLAYVEDQTPVALTRIVVFSVGGERYGLDIEGVVEIFLPDNITPVPGAPAELQGVTNLRGDIVTVIDVAKALGLDGRPVRGRQLVILATAGGVTAGLLVDDVPGIWDVETSTIDPPLNTLENIRADQLKGEFKLGNDLVGLLDAASLLEIKNNA